MVKRKLLFTVAVLMLTFLLFAINANAADVSNNKTYIEVETLNGLSKVSVKASEVYTFDSNGVITGVKPQIITTDKDGNNIGYQLSKVRAIHIPFGTVTVNIASSSAPITEMVIDENSNATIASVAGLKRLKSITVEHSSDVAFCTSCAPSTLKSLIFKGSDGTITFYENAFKGITGLTELKFSSGNTYKLGKNCFNGIGISQLDLVDEGSFEFTGEGAFYGCTSLKNVYVGKKTLSLENAPFDHCTGLDMVYITATTKIGDNIFRVAASGEFAEKKPLKVYIHTTTPVEISKNAFTNRGTHGVVLCAFSSDVTKFDNCKYEFHYGIPHVYEKANAEPTCYETYKTDCPCGQVKNAYYKLYKSGQQEQMITLISKENPDIPHRFTAAKSISYPNGFDNNGIVEPICSQCGKPGEKGVAPAMFVFLGYSVCESGDKAITVGILFNSVSIDQYKAATGGIVDFGVVLSSADALNGNNPLTSNGSVYSNKTVVKHDMSRLSIYESTLKLKGISNETAKTQFILSAYIRINGKTYYIDNGGVSENVTPVTYNSLLNKER